MPHTLFLELPILATLGIQNNTNNAFTVHSLVDIHLKQMNSKTRCTSLFTLLTVFFTIPFFCLTGATKMQNFHLRKTVSINYMYTFKRE